MRDDLLVATLVTGARAGDRQAWEELVERYAPLVWAICRRMGLARPDVEDVGQQVWLRMIEHLGDLREPAALSGWLVTTTRRECLRVLAQRRAELARAVGGEGLDVPADEASTAVDGALLAVEREAVLRLAFRQLRPDCQQLLALLIHDPPVPYREISAKLGIAVGSIGPTRGRCLEALRRSPALAALIRAETGRAEGGDGGA
jgi:RNA polymerase sigma factor (sigma-70 family)